MPKHNDGMRYHNCCCDYAWGYWEGVFMIDYEQIQHCLMHIISDCEDSESVLHTANHALNLLGIPETKYKVGDKVWMFNRGNNLPTAIVTDIDHESDEKYYIADVYDDWYKEEYLFPTKEALIEAQLEYWTKLKIDEISASKTCHKCGMQRMKNGVCWSMQCSLPITTNIEKCQHESDGQFYLPNPVRFKCLKCGEFYR